jgi:PTS system nitrogen regulatory IIA component
MKIEDFLSQDDVAVDVRSPGKAPMLQELAERAGARLNIDPARIALELQKREELGSTGVGAGIAIPHARMSEVSKPFGLIVRLKRPIDFKAIDGQPVDLVFLLLQPATALSDLNALASVARKLREPERVQRMRDAADAGALYQELTR